MHNCPTATAPMFVIQNIAGFFHGGMGRGGEVAQQIFKVNYFVILFKFESFWRALFWSRGFILFFLKDEVIVRNPSGQ